jgi:hypothetical protein
MTFIGTFLANQSVSATIPILKSKDSPSTSWPSYSCVNGSRSQYRLMVNLKNVQGIHCVTHAIMLTNVIPLPQIARKIK